MKLCPHCGMDLERDARIESGDVIFDPHAGLIVDGEPIRLTTTERLIVGTLIKAGGRAVSSGALIERMDSGSDYPEDVLRVCISKVRRRIGKSRIQNVHSYGYRWAA